VVAGKASPFLSKERLTERKHNVKDAQVAMANVHRQIDLLQAMFSTRLDLRFHCEPFGWHVYFFDDVAFLAGYFEERNNKPPVFKLVNRDQSFYKLFEKHLKDLQSKYPMLAGPA
jgi:hypothetical protein